MDIFLKTRNLSVKIRVSNTALVNLEWVEVMQNKFNITFRLQIRNSTKYQDSRKIKIFSRKDNYVKPYQSKPKQRRILRKSAHEITKSINKYAKSFLQKLESTDTPKGGQF